MVERVVVKRGRFVDSVALMLISRDVTELDGVERASIVNATPLNVELLERDGFAVEAGGEDAPGPNDLLIAIRAREADQIGEAVAAVEERLERQRAPEGGAAERPAPRSVSAAARRNPDLNLAVVSVPGRHAAYECARALDAGLDVFCFASGPTVEAEAALKARAAERGLMLMGPDCGTAIIGGISLGFANAIRPGPVGVVGASGTGVQALTCRLDAAGIGISHAIGTGGRDLSRGVGGTMARRGIELLADDPDTEALVVVAKSPDPAVARQVADAAARTGKPAALVFPGMREEEALSVPVTGSLEEAARFAAESVGGTLPAPVRLGSVREAGGAIRGLFSGGTLRDEALAVVAAATGRAETELEAAPAGGHVLVDLGDERFTEGRPHPMIDPGLRISMLEQAAADPAVGVLLIDVVLGYGAHPDPAGELAPAIGRALARRSVKRAAIVSLCGTERDPQGLDEQGRRLHEAGAVVTRSNADAARLALVAAGIEGATA